MFTIEETLDPTLFGMGLHYKVVWRRDIGIDKPVGYFSDFFMAAKVRDSLLEANDAVVVAGQTAS